jgi:hypothetical protein
VTIKGNNAFVAFGEKGLYRLNISNPDVTDLPLLGSFDSADARDVAIIGNFAYLADYSSGLMVLNVSDAAGVSVEPFGGYISTRLSFAVAVSGTQVYVADNHYGLASVSVPIPAFPVLADTTPATVTASASLAKMGNTVFTTTGGSNGMASHDVSNPEAVVPTIGALQLSSAGADAFDIAIRGSHAFIAMGHEGLAIVDISDPTHPVKIGAAAFDFSGNSAAAIAVSGSYAYIVTIISGVTPGMLVVFDISDPANPDMVASVAGPTGANRANELFISGTTVYVAYTNGLGKFDITEPTLPVMIDFNATVATWNDIAINGGIVYMAKATGTGGLWYTNSSLDAPQGYTSAVSTKAYALAVSGIFIYLAEGDLGIGIVSIANPASPVRIGSINLGGTDVHDLVVAGSYLYATDTTGNLYSIRLWEDME